MSESFGCGADIGTMNIVSARQTGAGVETRRVRDAFLTLEATHKKMLRLAGVSYAEQGDELIILGDAALDMANMLGREARRPLSAGFVSSSDMDAMKILGLLVKNVLGEPRVAGEHCYFSVPAAPVDVPGSDIIYHQGVLSRIVQECGYTPTASNEAMAVIFAETAKEGFSGIGASFGSGMSNFAFALNTVPGATFSVARGGDWIDAGAAKSIGSTASRICAVKEKGIDLTAPASREAEAITFYYKALIDYALDALAAKFKSLGGTFSFPKPVPFIVSGGTSRATGFLDLFKAAFDAKRKQFPFEISEIRPASDPMNAVAAGLLIQASQEYET